IIQAFLSGELVPVPDQVEPIRHSLSQHAPATDSRVSQRLVPPRGVLPVAQEDRPGRMPTVAEIRFLDTGEVDHPRLLHGYRPLRAATSRMIVDILQACEVIAE